MPRFDPDTIAALAEGLFDTKRALELEGAIADDPLASAELAAQRLALEASRDVSAPTLTDTERVMLRSAVASALGLELSGAEQAGRQRRRVPWPAISIAAAALVALVAAAPLADLLSAGDGATAAPTFDASAEPATTVAASEALVTDQADPFSEEAPALTDLVGDGSTTSTLEASDSTRTSLGDTATRQRLVAALDSVDAQQANVPTADAPCVAQGTDYLGDAGLVTTTFETDDGTALVVYYVVDDAGTVTLAAGFDPTDCTIRVTCP